MGNFRFNPFTKKLDIAEVNTVPAGSVDFLTGNSGSAVAPDGSGNINIVGTGTVTVTGNAVAHSLTISTTAPMYSSGTWIPSLVGGTMAGTPVYVAQEGFYYKINNVVFCDFYMEIDTTAGNIGGGTGDAQLQGLPFAASSSVGQGQSNQINCVGLLSTPNGNALNLQYTAASTSATLFFRTGNAVSITTAQVDSNFNTDPDAGNDIFFGTFFYFV